MVVPVAFVAVQLVAAATPGAPTIVALSVGELTRGNCYLRTS